MPGGRSRSFRLGDRSELLVQQLLTSVAFTTSVPRQEDIGLDFLCSLITGYGGPNLLKAGPFFSVQAKSDTDPIKYEKPHEIEWITSQENPLLICVADRDAGAMDVYSTWNLLCGVQNGWRGQSKPNCINLCPGKSSTWDWRGVEDLDDGSQNVLLGKPIVRITHEDIFNESRTQQLASVLGAWIAIDRENIVRCKTGMYWVVGPLSYETGIIPPQPFGVNLYWNPTNLSKCTENLVLSAVALWKVLRVPQLTEHVKQQPWSDGVGPLKELILWALKASPNLKQFLKNDVDGI